MVIKPILAFGQCNAKGFAQVLENFPFPFKLPDCFLQCDILHNRLDHPEKPVHGTIPRLVPEGGFANGCYGLIYGTEPMVEQEMGTIKGEAIAIQLGRGIKGPVNQCKDRKGGAFAGYGSELA